MRVGVLRREVAEHAIRQKPAEPRRRDDYESFAGVAAGVALGSLVWLGLIWFLKTVL